MIPGGQGTGTLGVRRRTPCRPPLPMGEAPGRLSLRRPPATTPHTTRTERKESQRSGESDGLDGGPLAATSVPEGEHLQLLLARRDPVVEEVADPPQQDPPNATEPSAGNNSATRRLGSDELQCDTQLARDGIPSGRPVLLPPRLGALDLAAGGCREDNRQRRVRHRARRRSRSSAVTTSPRSASRIDFSSSSSSEALNSTSCQGLPRQRSLGSPRAAQHPRLGRWSPLSPTR